MAALIAAKRTTSLFNIFQKLLSSPSCPLAASGSSAARTLNTNAQIRESDDNRAIDIDRRSSDRGISRRRSGDRGLSRRRSDGFPAQLTDVLDPFVPRSVSQLLNIMDSVFDGPFSMSSRAAGGARRGWDAREDKEALYLRMDMPGLGKDDVNVIAEQGTLVIKGEGEAEEGEEETRRRYSTRIDLAPELYKMEEIKAQMKNGVLKIVVPKVKEEERKDVVQVKIE